jgi:hypothetical protein
MNLSDGTTDGFALFYIKDGKLCSVVLNQDQKEMLDLTLSMVFKGQQARIIKSNAEVMKKYLDESEANE